MRGWHHWCWYFLAIYHIEVWIRRKMASWTLIFLNFLILMLDTFSKWDLRSKQRLFRELEITCVFQACLHLRAQKLIRNFAYWTNWTTKCKHTSILDCQWKITSMSAGSAAWWSKCLGHVFCNLFKKFIWCTIRYHCLFHHNQFYFLLL